MHSKWSVGYTLKRRWFIYISLYFWLSSLIPVFASDYGTVGLIDTPTARMSSDGTFITSTSWQDRTKSFALTYQVTPWFEGTFRYTGQNYYKYWDRNFGVKFRIIEETEKFPQISIGIRDIVGTGRAGGDYIVATKQYGNYDFTFGLGWGRLAGDGDFKNPLTLISDKFSKRKASSSKGGRLSIDSYFAGERVGFFGGLSYNSPTLPLSYIFEYNPDLYTRPVIKGAPKPEKPFSAAIKWNLSQNYSMTLSHQHFQEWGLNFSASIDSKSLPPRAIRPSIISSLDLSQTQLPNFINKNKWYDTLLFDVERSGILLIEASINEDTQTAIIVMGNVGFPVWSDALATMINLADRHLPKNIKTLNIVIEEEGHRLQSIKLNRGFIGYANSRQLIQEKIQIEPPIQINNVQYKTLFSERRIVFDYNLSWRTQLFDPDDPMRYQWFARLGMRMNLPGGWVLNGKYSQNIYHNFDESRRSASSRLPNVRSEIVKYLKNGATGLDSLHVEKRGNITNDIYYRLYGGILEQMYSGIGGELLYHPFQSRFSYGLSGNYVKKRDYDRSFKHLDYETETAFASIYYASPFYNLDFAVHAGKYLATDKGATFEIRRSFNNGWMLGIWATLTNVSARDFGEGSFDKGMFFNIPISNILNTNDRSTFKTYLRPIQRDGGQRLEDFSGNIWWDTRSASYDAFMKTTTRKFLSGFSTKQKSKTDQNVFQKYYNEK